MEANNKERVTKLIWYFTIFSVIGLIVETVYCFVTCNGTIESRKGLLIGPFCPIYGVGAIVIIAILNRFHKKPIKLFILGTILGSVVEYALSYTLEAMYGSRFWDYSYLTLNINGRISLIYSAFWGVLSIVLIDYIKPAIDHFINKIQPKKGKKIEIGLITFFIIDAILTVVAISTYTNIAQEKYKEMKETSQVSTEIEENNADDENNEEIEQEEDEEGIEQEENKEETEQNTDGDIFFNKIMPAIFPNIRIRGENGEEIWVREIMQAKE